MKCKSCGAILDVTHGGCPACGAAVELGRLTGILGVVCRDCDSYNEPGARVCAACGAALGRGAEPSPAPAPPAAAAPPAPSVGSLDLPGQAPAARPPASPPPAPAPAGPVVRSFERPASGPATRFVPAAGAPRGAAGSGAGAPGAPAPPRSSCPRCGARAGPGRFCAQCGQPLGAPGTAVALKAPPGGSPVATRIGALAPGAVKLIVEGGSAAGASFPLDDLRVEAGRDRGAIAFPDDPYLAPHHATFSFRGGALHLRDEGAPGGVFLRLRALSVPLRAGDHFALGGRLLRYAGRVAPPAEAPPDGTRRLGSPRPAAPAIVIEEWLEGGAPGRVFVRVGPSVTLGRAAAVVNLGDDPDVSQAHAEILVDAAGSARLKDLGSSKGTYLRLPPHGERELREGDLVRMGRQVLRVAVG